MDIPVVMPQMGESIAEGTVTRWLKKTGQSVQRDEPLLEISTDKVDSEIPSPASGVLREIRVQEGKTVPVGEVLALIEGQAGAVRGAPLVGESAARAAAAPPRPATSPPAGPASAAGASRAGHFLSPLVQKMAAEAGLSAAELESIPGSGKGGRLRREDLERHLAGRGAAPGAAASGAPAGRPAAPAAGAAARTTRPAATASAAAAAFSGGVEAVAMDAMRKAIAEHMLRSVRTSPHVTSVSECDLTEVVRFRERERDRLEKREGVKLTYLPFVARAVIRAIAEFPWLNASVDGEKILVKRFVNLGIAVSLETAGLIVPVVREAHRKSFWELARAIEDLARRARERRLKPDEVQEGTFTLTNPGVFGGLIGTPIIHQPQVAILALGAVSKRPVVVEGDAIAIRSMLYLSLSYDHRVVDGALGVQFLERVRQHLEKFDYGEAR